MTSAGDHGSRAFFDAARSRAERALREIGRSDFPVWCLGFLQSFEDRDHRHLALDAVLSVLEDQGEVTS